MVDRLFVVLMHQNPFGPNENNEQDQTASDRLVSRIEWGVPQARPLSQAVTGRQHHHKANNNKGSDLK